MKLLSSRSVSVVRFSAIATLAALGLTGCYVVPMQPGQALPPGPVTVVPAQSASTAPLAPLTPVAQTFTARLYPSNAEAASYGTIAGTVTNDMNGRGYFNAVIGGEQFQGEATRVAGSAQRGGMANASGTRGGMLSCRYTMNSATLGTGSCVLNNGPSFTMHVGG